MDEKTEAMFQDLLPPSISENLYFQIRSYPVSTPCKAEEAAEPWYLEDGVVLAGVLGVISLQ